MRARRERSWIFGLVACVFLGCAGSGPNSADRELGASVEQPIIAGMPGGPAAVGHVFPVSRPYDFCTATLIAPDLVLTAKHCVYVAENPLAGRVMDEDIVKFTVANTNDPTKWTDAVRVIQLYVAPTVSPLPSEDHYFRPDLTSDVAVYRLATPIANVAPIAIAADAPGPANTDFVTAGFGRTSHAGADAVSRNIGTLTFALNGGSALKRKFPTLTEYVIAVMDIAPGTNTVQLQEEYQHEVLARDYEMLFDAPSNSQVCIGDWGGPLLQKDVMGNYRVFGVASGAKSYGTSRCYFGSVYATFGPATLLFLETVGVLPRDDGGPHPVFDGGWPFDANLSFDVVGSSGGGGFGGSYPVGVGGAAGWAPSGSGGRAAGTTTAGGGGGPGSAGRGEAGDSDAHVTNTTGCACRLRDRGAGADRAVVLAAMLIAALRWRTRSGSRDRAPARVRS